MANTATTDRAKTQESAVEALVTHLKSQPFQTNYSADELGQQFGLDTEFVARVLSSLKGQASKSSLESLRDTIRLTIRTKVGSVKSLFRRVTDLPYWYIATVFVLGGGFLLLYRFLLVLPIFDFDAQAIESRLGVAGVWTGSIICVLQGMLFLRKGMARYPVFAGAVLAVLLGVLVVVLDPNDGSSTITRILSMVFFGATFAIVGVGLSLIGGLFKVQREDRRDRNLSRQKVLESVFELQEELKTAQRKIVDDRPVMFEANAWRDKKGFVFYAAALGGVLGGLTVVLMNNVAENTLGYSVFNILLLLTALCFYMFAGYLAGGLRRAIVVACVMFGVAKAIEFIPYGRFGLEHSLSNLLEGQTLRSLAGATCLAIIAALGAHVDERANFRKRLSQRDPATLVAELVRRQWLLNPKSAAQCVVVVDVAGSTRLKANADPLAVEWSFRAYQDMLADIAERRGGEVLSTAGDGAVLSFPTCAEALYGAKEVQAGMGRFNADVNRLDDPFRLRIGIHTGQVQAELAEVPFNELIDIAAHVEKEAPVGGIAITAPVALDMPEERVAEMKDLMHGHKMFIVLNPTSSS